MINHLARVLRVANADHNTASEILELAARALEAGESPTDAAREAAWVTESRARDTYAWARCVYSRLEGRGACYPPEDVCPQCKRAQRELNRVFAVVDAVRRAARRWR